MIDPVWSWILPAFGVAAVWLGPSNRWGWALGVCGQCLWLVYGLHTHQHGFVLSALLFGAAHLKNFLEATRLQSRREQARRAGLAGLEPGARP